MSKLNIENPLFKSEPTEEKEKKKPGRPRRDDLIRDGSTQNNLTIDYTRFTCICKAANVKDIKDYAYTKRITTKEAFDEIVEYFFKNYRKNPKNEELLDHTRGKG